MIDPPPLRPGFGIVDSETRLHLLRRPDRAKISRVTLLSLVLGLALVPAVAPACPDRDTEHSLRLGPATAEIEVHAFVDPIARDSVLTWLRLRRLVADRNGEIAVEIHWVGSSDRDPAARHQGRAFVASLAAAGHTTAALRVVARDGDARLGVRLADPAQYDALAAELSVPRSVVEAAATDACTDAAVQRDSARLRRQLGTDATAVQRLPVFAIDGFGIEDTANLETLMGELGRYGARRRRLEDPRPPSPPPPRPAVSERMERPDLDGMLLGGPGLPHRLVVMARSETDLSIAAGLPHALALRRLAPGRTAVHLVARGVSTGAEVLRARLCAAQHLGLGMAYAEYLARDTIARQEPDAADQALLEALDGVDPAVCAEQADPVALDLPDGTWLDGWPRSRGELGTLPTTVRMLDASERPLDAVLLPADTDP